jgi:bacterioferritin (cytochrome b1)
MATLREELISLLNKALELEHAARFQYLSHAEQVKGLYSEKAIERLKEIAADEEKHEQKFRNLIGAYLDGVPSMGVSPTKAANTIEDILRINLASEMQGVDLYQTIYEKICACKHDLRYKYHYMEHELRHIIVDEEEHIAELRQLEGR